MTHKLLAEIVKADVDIEETQALLEHQKAYREGLMDKLVERINKGDTTGDRIRDLVLQSVRKSDTELENRYRELENRLAGHGGELILFSYLIEVLEMSRRGGPEPGGSWDSYRSLWCIACGKLDDEKLHFDKGRTVTVIRRIGFDSPLYARKDVPSPRATPVVAKYIVSPFEYASSYKTRLSLEETSEDVFHKHFESDNSTSKDSFLIVGDANVRDWFAKNATIEQFERCCELLNKLVLV